MTPAHPLITIGITCFNAEQSIKKSIRSALEQDWQNTEIIVVDDNSQDKSLETIRSISLSHPRFQIIPLSQNKGVAHARNRIIDKAKGDFIAFFDDDDASEPDRLRCQYNAIIEYENLHPCSTNVFCHTARLQYYPDRSERIEKAFNHTNNGASSYDEDVATGILCGRNSELNFGAAATCSQMARTSTYRALRGFDEALRRGEDTDIAIRGLLLGCKFVSVDAPKVIQTMTNNSHKRITDEEHYNFILLDKHKDLIISNTCLENYYFTKKWLTFKFAYLSGKRIFSTYLFVRLLFSHPVRTLRRSYLARRNMNFHSVQRKFHHG